MIPPRIRKRGIRRRAAPFLVAPALLLAAGPARPIDPDSLALVRSFMGSGSLARALGVVDRHLDEADSLAGSDTEASRRAIDLFVEVLWKAGRSADPRTQALARKAVETRRQSQAVDPASLASGLANYAIVLNLAGDLIQARAPFEEALELRRRTEGPDSPELAASMNGLANLLTQSGEFSRARTLYQSALEIRTRAYGPLHPAVGQSLNNLGNLERMSGDLAAARQLYEKALEVREKSLGPEHPDVAQTLDNLAIVLRLTGDYGRARILEERSLSIRQKNLGPDHPDVAMGFNNLANILRSSGDTRGARANYEKSIEVWTAAGAGAHPNAIATLGNLGGLLLSMGQDSSALQVCEKAVGSLEAAGGADTPIFASMLNGLAEAREATGDSTGAEEVIRRAIGLDEKLLDPSSMDLSADLSAHARMLFQHGHASLAFTESRRAEEVRRDNVRLTVRVLPEWQALVYAGLKAPNLGLMISAALGPGSADSMRRAAYDAVIRSRALVLDEMLARHRSLADPAQPGADSLARNLLDARRDLANLIVRGPGAVPPEQYKQLLRSAYGRKERCEEEVAEHAAGEHPAGPTSRTGESEISEALAPGDKILSFVRFERFTEEGPHSRRSGDEGPSAPRSESYAAFVLGHGDCSPALVELGPASGLDTLIARWRREAGRDPSGPNRAGAERSCREAGAALRRAVWDPVSERLTGATRIFVVPDGALNFVSFDALPVGESRFLAEAGPVFQYLSTERDLADDGFPAVDGGLLALGDPAFDKKPADPRHGGQSASVFRGSAAQCRDFNELRFTPLPASGAEARDVARLWRSRFEGRSGRPEFDTASAALVLTGREASEAGFKLLARRMRVLHLATHAFYLGDCPSVLLEPVSDAGRLSDALQSSVVGENPLVLSGVALAGANLRSAPVAAGHEADDGVLTAEEVAALDLGQVDWAVLSGCESGLGIVQGGEGILGLRRAFQIAGVRTVIMSLWGVEDQATRRWMTELYRRHWHQGLGTAESARAASLAVLRERRSSGAGTHPFYWAAFVAAGNGR